MWTNTTNIFTIKNTEGFCPKENHVGLREKMLHKIYQEIQSMTKKETFLPN